MEWSLKTLPNKTLARVNNSGYNSVNIVLLTLDIRSWERHRV